MKAIDKKLDTIFSIWIRLKYTNDYGHGNCYTCDDVVSYDKAQCGHYPNISRNNTQFRWNTIIHKMQCQNCNEFKAGEAEAFRDRLINEIGLINVAKYEFLAKKPYKWSLSEKYILFKNLKSECKEMLKDKMFSVKLP